MRDIENNDLGAKEGSCNPTIIDLRDRAQLTKTAREMMNSMYDKIAADDIRKGKENKRIQERAEELKKEIGVDREGDER